MKSRLPILVMAFLSVCAHAAGQSLTADEIDKAIQAGQTGKHKQLIATCQAVIGFREVFRNEKVGLNFLGSYEVNLSQTAGQIALMAAAAKRFYKPFTVEQVPDNLKTAGVVMTAEPSQPEESSTLRGAIWVAAPIELMVLRVWPRGSPVRPVELTTEPVEWPNVAGQTLRGNRARAEFRIGEILEMPQGELEVVVVTPAGERTCILSSRDRRRVFGR
jgi:hypothetical protein